MAPPAGWINRDLILVTILVFGSARAFQTPTTAALLPAVVPTEVLSRAVAASSSTNQIAIIAGPAIGGMLYAVSPPLVYALSAALFLIASLLIWPIRIVRQPPRRAPVTFELVFAGIVYIWRNPIIRGAISLDLFAVLLGGATALLPIYARDIFGTGPMGLGLLQMSPALGALAMSIPLVALADAGTGRARRCSRRWPASAAPPSCSACRGSFPLTMLALAAYGAADMVSVVIRDTLDPGRHPGPDAGQGERRAFAVHRHLQPARRNSAPA